MYVTFAYLCFPPPDGNNGAWLPFPGFPPRKLPAAEVHRETAGDPARGGQRKAGQGRERQRETGNVVFVFKKTKKTTKIVFILNLR